MADLIERSAVIEALDRFSLGETDAVKLSIRMGDYMKRMPAVDAVQVVRCKDCKYCWIVDPHEAWCYGGLPAQLTRADDDFCSHGQRREGKDGADGNH